MRWKHWCEKCARNDDGMTDEHITDGDVTWAVCDTLECGCVVRAVDSSRTVLEVVELCARHARCPICGGPRPGGADHTRCTTNGYEGLDYRLP
jgi:hypothetical protein